MNMMSICIAPLVLTAAAVTNPVPSDPVLAALQQTEDSSLSDLRAGAPVTMVALGDEDLATLRAADQQNGGLADLRGGVMTDHDITLIVVVVLAVIAIAIIL